MKEENEENEVQNRLCSRSNAPRRGVQKLTEYLQRKQQGDEGRSYGLWFHSNSNSESAVGFRQNRWIRLQKDRPKIESGRQRGRIQKEALEELRQLISILRKDCEDCRDLVADGTNPPQDLFEAAFRCCQDSRSCNLAWEHIFENGEETGFEEELNATVQLAAQQLLALSKQPFLNESMATRVREFYASVQDRADLLDVYVQTGSHDAYHAARDESLGRAKERFLQSRNADAQES